MSSTLAPIDDLESQFAKLKQQLTQAERARISPADRHAQEIRQQLADKQAELQHVQELESQAVAEQQQQEALAALREMEQDMLSEKSRLDGLRTQYSQLASEIQRTEFRHGAMLRAFAQAKQRMGV
jgi:hypothetical protein